ncbi:Polyisoprenoid-binding protein YceI [Chryseolinea serpens]|uniref:Polyisoprenoid-binding protein YceI n=1 Tax=Chryseolinea serpens TaxID=947013 RepID=A0A1M5TCW3_9BACT|nr:YceI family protein [Chryseolinea serpens]SHH48193.1 Polyisoprenoid-binding protein YceI [Chryseolinea serpens]
MKKRILLFALTCSAAAAFSQTTWTIDNAHSKIGFIITHMAISEVEGKFNDFNGTLISKNDSFDGAEVTFSAKTGTVDTDNERRDGHLKSPDFFDAEKYPEITFKGNLVKSGTGYKLKGNLIMHGVTKPVELDVTGGNTVNTGRGIKSGFKINGTINRKDFGLTWSNATPTGELVVSDQVVLNLKIELDKKA